MKVLHILKSEPDDIVQAFMAPFAEGHQVEQVALYKGPVDYDGLLAKIFEHDKIICWW